MNRLEEIDKKSLKDTIRNNVPNRVNISRPLHRKRDLVVSLTSVPSRMDDMYFAVYSILNQSEFADKVILWLGEEFFPDKFSGLPKQLLDFQKYGLEIYFVHDVGSYTKLIPALKKYPDADIVTADDDLFYPQDWLKELVHEHMKFPKDIIAHRCHQITFSNNGAVKKYSEWNFEQSSSVSSYSNFLTGVGGVLYPADSLYKEVLDENFYMKHLPKADDIWFWGMAVMNGRKIRTLKREYVLPKLINLKRHLGDNSHGNLPLHLLNVGANANDAQFKNLIEKYPQILKRLQFCRGHFVFLRIFPYNKFSFKKIMKAILPYGVVRLIQFCRTKREGISLQGGNEKEYCPYCNACCEFIPCGAPNNIRPHGMCPVCGSQERDRSAFYLYQILILAEKNDLNLLHIAPESCVSSLIRSRSNIRYFCMDLYPEKYPYVQDLIEKRDVLDTKYDSMSFDVIIANHVVEHVAEKAFCEEMKRILKPSGFLIISTPVYWDEAKTLDKTVYTETSELRTHYFGQSDHLRKYGADIASRFEPYFDVHLFTANNLRPYGDILNTNFLILKNKG